ncbi:HEAT repeat domain-containing protein [Aminobacter sp. MET-1]|uniref:HEAT repeat domain-containing protein n=1 Tax=Aminobacter sp. MET-1 TaxID=2951085 RepID=UPI00226A0F7E|nr:HEAT repeat domain-containing protein [Aminobacter sp. MET-1]MCX8568370.1 HEAT repeat domain-containing protein [Aminobacter sp. MET-1]
MLGLVWTTSIVLSSLSLAVMVFLVLRRVIFQRRVDRDAAARRKLLKVLIQFSQTRDRDLLKAAVLETPAHVALDAGFEFLSLLRGDEHADVIAAFVECGLPERARRRLVKGNEAERIHSTEMLAAFGGDETVAALLATLDRDRSREVRIAAAIALSDLAALPLLDVTLARIGVAGQRSRRLIELFRRFPSPRFGELKDYAADVEAVPFVRSAAIEALAQSGDPVFADFFGELALHGPPEVAAAAVRGLGKIGLPSTAAIVVEAMSSSDWAVRSDAAEAAGRLGLAHLVDPLANLLDDEEWTVRYAAAKALRAMVPHGEMALEQIARSETSRRQRTASLVLSEGVHA